MDRFIFERTSIEGVYIIEPRIFGDSRGYFMESYKQQTLEGHNIKIDFVQDNHSLTTTKGTLRGIHFQSYPEAQTKLVSCTRGAVLDVAVDLRSDSRTFKQYVAVELSADNHQQLFIPKGFGHAFLTLTDDVEFQYKVDEYYSQEHDRSIRFDDPELAIDWGITDPILSDKDRNAPLLKDCNFIL